MNIMKNIFSTLFIIIGIWQFFVTINYFKTLKKSGGKSTSAFSPMAIWFSFILAITFIILGLSSLFNWL
ncbi:hypothetical protein FC97_GL000228 [Companilactobacillus kimchii DSM 13961 = JCM 10707]|uniref:Immunity protein n=2 Tax=Companilactobacillus kimchii TaxID=2801452 RepID=A0ABR5NUJ1_9LACO|nr:hypothetical protein FC97_GL000228 [Companilactobacillus kimchii DSM 13961 = JCM 10707]